MQRALHRVILAGAAVCGWAAVGSAQVLVSVTPALDGDGARTTEFIFTADSNGVEYDTVALDPSVDGGGIRYSGDVPAPLNPTTFAGDFVDGTELLGAELGLLEVPLAGGENTLFGGTTLLGSPTPISELFPSLDFARVVYNEDANNTLGSYNVSFLRSGVIVASASGTFGFVPEPGAALLATLGLMASAGRLRR